MRLAGLLAIFLCLAVRMPAAPASDTPLEAAALAWDTGDYVSALNTYLRLLDANPDETTFETIALQTGELFHTHELTNDGEAPAFSPDGRHLVYESGDPLEPRIYVLTADGNPRPAVELTGFRAAFSPDGSKLAYLKLTPSQTLRDAYVALLDAPQNERTQRAAAFNAVRGREARLTVRELVTGAETEIPTGALQKSALAFGTGGAMLIGAAVDNEPVQIYIAAGGRAPMPVTSGPNDKILGAVNADGAAALYTVRIPRRRTGSGQTGSGQTGSGQTGSGQTGSGQTGSGQRGSGQTGSGQRGSGQTGSGQTGSGQTGSGQTGSEQTGSELTDSEQTGSPQTFGVILLPEARAIGVPGSAPAFGRDGKAIVYVRRERNDYQIVTAPTSNPLDASIVCKGPERLDAPVLSADGRVAFQKMAKEDWEIFVATKDGKEEQRITREIQHDVVPQFLANDRLLATIGEPRHRRSYLYDLPSMKRTRLFHNNTIRTIAPEYAWVASPDGKKVVIVAERDGDTVSPERGIYYVDLSKRITRDELRARLRANLEAEQALRAKAERMYAPIATDVAKVVEQASAARIFTYEKTLFDFDSKHISRPGNKRASAYLFDTYKSFGYDPAYQWFEPRNALGGETANVIATLKGTVNPELVYVVSSHYDSVAVGPGADDDSSGTAALLETARILAGHPQPATIVFASFTGEEAGLLGSREFVRRAVASKMKIAGALNNDMVGWANDHRLDNTIRYSNPGIRDVQHAAAMQFTRMITYDALYFKSTDAAAYYEAYGDIVGGIGSYPVLGNPHYHQSHDILETINHQLVTEVAKTTAATLMLLASSPSRLTGLQATRSPNGTIALSWSPSPETGVTGYIVSFESASPLRVSRPSATLPPLARGTIVGVKAVNAKGLESWDSARIVIK